MSLFWRIGGNFMKLFHSLFPIVQTSGEIIGLTQELKMIYLFQLWNQQKRNILIVTNSLYEANRCYQRLSKYTEQVYFFPMDDFLTSEALAISPELKVTRLETLNQLTLKGSGIVVTNLMGFLRFLPSKEVYQNSRITLRIHEQIDMHTLIEQLLKLGYTKETIVNKTGEIAIRGFVLDIFPLGENHPIRIELWGDEIDSIREFNIDSQLTIREIEEIAITPNTEFLVNEVLEIEPKQRELGNYIKPSMLLEFLDNPILAFENYEDISRGYQTLCEEIFEYQCNNHEKYPYMHSLENIKANDMLYLNNFDNQINKENKIEKFQSQELEMFHGTSEKIKAEILKYKKKTVIICVSNRYQVNKLLEEWNDIPLIFTSIEEITENAINIVIYPITQGF